MSEAIAIGFSIACVAIILCHCALFVWIRKMEGR
jgi:hypothetical protein